MFNLYKANVVRMAKSSFYIFGCIVALVVTYAISSNMLEISFLAGTEPVQRMYFVSAAMVAFFTIFIPVFTNSEYADGVIRNKMIAGRSQKEIYISHLLAHMTAATVMWIFYIVGGLIGGANLNSYYVIGNVILLIALYNFIATMMVVAFRFKKMVGVIIFAAIIFNSCFNSLMMGNMMLMITKGTTQYVVSCLYNISALGQWFTYTGFSDDVANPGSIVQILISAAIIVLMTLIGTFRLNKRDIV